MCRAIFWRSMSYLPQQKVLMYLKVQRQLTFVPYQKTYRTRPSNNTSPNYITFDMLYIGAGCHSVAVTSLTRIPSSDTKENIPNDYMINCDKLDALNFFIDGN